MLPIDTVLLISRTKNVQEQEAFRKNSMDS